MPNRHELPSEPPMCKRGLTKWGHPHCGCIQESHLVLTKADVYLKFSKSFNSRTKFKSKDFVLILVNVLIYLPNLLISPVTWLTNVCVCVCVCVWLLGPHSTERRPLKDHWKTENCQGLSAVSISEICCLCGMAPKTPERPLKDQKQLFQQDPVGPWRQLKVYWETNKTIERSLKDHLAYCQRSLKDQSRSLKDWPRPLKELWKTDQDPRENSDRKKKWETVKRSWKD